MRPLMRRHSGFTLVEVMVALLVMSLMSVLAWRGLDGLLKSRDITQSHLQHSARLQTVVAQWEQDLLALQDSGNAPALSFDGATLRITRQRPSGMQVVAWSLRNGGLYRWEDRPVQTVAALQESLQRSQQSLSQDKTQLLTIEGVSGWQMFFYRGNGWSNAQSSDDQASPAAPPRSVLPSGVRMILQFAPGSEFSGSLTRQIELGPQS
jgi:general secretion pathway protein J